MIAILPGARVTEPGGRSRAGIAAFVTLVMAGVCPKADMTRTRDNRMYRVIERISILIAAGGSSRRAPGPWYGLAPAWQSTWIEHAASLDSTCPQPDGERIVTWPPSTD